MKKVFFTLFLLGLATAMLALELDLEQAKELGLAQNPTLAAQKMQVKSQHWNTLSAWSQLLPTASLNGSYRENSPASPSSNSKSFEFSVSQPLFRGGQLWGNASIQKKNEIIAQWNLQDQILATLNRVETKYHELLRQQELREIAQKDLAAAQKHLETGQIRLQNGTISQTEWLQLQAEEASKQVAFIQKENAVQTAQTDLANELQLTEPFSLESVDFQAKQPIVEALHTLSVDESNQLLNQLLRKGNQKSPTVKVAEVQWEMARTNHWLSYGQFLPDVSLSYNKSWSQSNLDDEYSDSERWGISVSVPLLPVVNHYSQAKKTHYSQEKSQWEWQAAKDANELAIKKQYYDWLAQARMIRASELSLQYSEQAFEQSEVRFQNGLINATDLLDAEVRFRTAQQQHINNWYLFLEQESSLLRQIGCDDMNQLERMIITK